MKKNKLFLLALIAVFSMMFTACNSDDDVFNSETENYLKIVNGSTPGSGTQDPSSYYPVPTGTYLLSLEPYGNVRAWNYYSPSFESYNLLWYDTPAMTPSSGKNRSVIFNDAESFNRTILNSYKIKVDFTRCTVIATQFRSPFVLEGSSRWIKKHAIIRSSTILHMDIRVEVPQGAGVMTATTYPTVIMVIPKMPDLTTINTRIQNGYGQIETF